LSAERSGALPLYTLWALSRSHRVDLAGILRSRISGHGGLVDLFGTNDLRRIPYSGQGGVVRRALALGIAREIGRRAAIASFRVEALVLTGGLAHDEKLMRAVLQSVGWVAERHFVFAGENEMLALAQGALRILQGRETALDYTMTHA
jgi:butyrate kinase